MTDHAPLTDTQLDDIEARVHARRAALSGWINCYSPLSEQEALENAEAVLEEDVPALVAELRRQRAVLADLATRWTQLADQGDTAIGHFDGPAAATLNAEVAERGSTYRKAADDVREVLASGCIPGDLLTDANYPQAAPASVVSVSSADGGNQ